jgi:hypothetical protein
VIDMLEARAATKRGLKLLPRSARAGGRRWADMSPGALAQALATSGKCTAVVKVNEDLSEIYFGHSTWDNYMAMLRIFKHYELNYDLGLGKGKGSGDNGKGKGKGSGDSGGGSGDGGYTKVAAKLSFSSYPGELFSDDDLYMTSNGLVVLETTNHIYDPAVYDKLTPRCVLSWQRVRTASLLAASGAEWVALFKRHNSGTYNVSEPGGRRGRPSGRAKSFTCAGFDGKDRAQHKTTRKRIPQPTNSNQKPKHTTEPVHGNGPQPLRARPPPRAGRVPRHRAAGARTRPAYARVSTTGWGGAGM